MAGSPSVNEQALLDAFGEIHDPHERLSLITGACAGPGLSGTQRHGTDVVAGCVSRVWLRRVEGGVEGGVALRLEWDAESPLVRGLAGLLCQVYQDTDPAEARQFRSRILSLLGLDRQLSPTRLRGLAAMELRIKELASA